MFKDSSKINGGKARAKKLSPRRRKEISKIAVLAKKERASLPKTICGTEDKMIICGDFKIQCFVLEEETRVLTLSELLSGFSMSIGGGRGGLRKIPGLMARLAKKGIDIKGLDVRANNPILFIKPDGQIANGYDAKLLPDICSVLIDADRKGGCGSRITRYADRAALVQHGFSTMGIISLVDKITGYDDFQKARDFGQILKAFVAKELRPYVKTFPPEWYKQICKLRNIPYDPNSVKYPSYFGHITNNLVYKRTAPGVWAEIKKLSKDSNSLTKPHLHRYLTLETGVPRLNSVLYQGIGVMKLSKDWSDFMKKLEIVLPTQPQVEVKQLEAKYKQMELDGMELDGSGL